MKVKAKISFVGKLNMVAGEVKECSDEATLQDLLNAGYIEVVEEEKAEVIVENEVIVDDEKLEKVKKTTKKVVKGNENKRY